MQTYGVPACPLLCPADDTGCAPSKPLDVLFVAEGKKGLNLKNLNKEKGQAYWSCAAQVLLDPHMRGWRCLARERTNGHPAPATLMCSLTKQQHYNTPTGTEWLVSPAVESPQLVLTP